MTTPGDDRPSMLQRVVFGMLDALFAGALREALGEEVSGLEGWQPTGVLIYEGEGSSIDTTRDEDTQSVLPIVMANSERRWVRVLCPAAYGLECGAIQLALSVPGPIGVACGCGWRFGTYNPESNTLSDDGSSILSLIVELEEAITQSQHGQL